MRPNGRTRINLVGLWLAVAAATAVVAGCNIAGPAFLLIHGPEKVPQLHELEKERPVVVFLDDRNFTISRAPTRERVAASAGQSLLKAGAVSRVLDSKAANAVVNGEPRGDLMPISQVGRKVGAEVVIYVVPERFSLSPDGQTFEPVAQLRIKVIDAVADKRLWPEEREGYLLTVTATTRQGTAPTDASQAREAENRFADLAGQRVAELFYDHEVETVADERDR